MQQRLTCINDSNSQLKLEARTLLAQVSMICIAVQASAS